MKPIKLLYKKKFPDPISQLNTQGEHSAFTGINLKV